MKISTFIKSLMVASVVLFSACDKFSDQMSDSYSVEESAKAVDGTWRVISVSRNGSDITTMIDFSKFRLNLKPDYSYTMDDRMPFLVGKSGEWKLDDPQYPFNITFTQTGAKEGVTSQINYFVTNGRRQLSFSFSPGCVHNTYTYVFEKVK